MGVDMENIIINKPISHGVSREILRILPPELADEISEISCRFPVEEIRVRTGKNSFLSCGGENIRLTYTASAEDVERLVSRLCKDSLYAHAETINKGYIVFDGGVRVGVCGRANCVNGRIVGVSDICSVVIRIPHRVKIDVGFVRRIIENCGMSRGVLVFSPPSVGKTSFLRETARLFASGDNPRRVCVVDTRGELAYSLGSESACLDLLSGYPKPEGIRIAALTLGAEIIICDEIGSPEETEAILDIHGGGVPLIASAHAADMDDLLSRQGISRLDRAGIFEAYIRLERSGDCMTFGINMRDSASW